jgi:hypothetical protein
MNHSNETEILHGRWLALAEVSMRTLEAVEAELGLVVGQQAECAAAIGSSLHSLPTGRGEPADRLPEIVAALQAEDSIRQHQEQIGRLLARLRGAIAEMAETVPETADDAERRALAARMLEGIPLAGMLDRFSRRLDATTESPVSVSGPGDIELF